MGGVLLGFEERLSYLEPSVLHLDLENPWDRPRRFSIHVEPHGEATNLRLARRIELEAGARRKKTTAAHRRQMYS